MNYSLLAATPLFRGITQTEIESMLICLNAREREYPKDTAILRAGDTTHELGLVLAEVFPLRAMIFGETRQFSIILAPAVYLLKPMRVFRVKH